MRKVIILNYMLGCVDVVTLPLLNSGQLVDVEEYLEEIGYKMSQIEWMMSPEEGTRVFYDNDECPTYTL